MTMTTTYLSVRHKQTEGTITLSDEEITFRSSSADALEIPWLSIAKHQVSPASHPKALLKLVLKSGSSLTFSLVDRSELERLRKDVTQRLHKNKSQTNGGRKRPHSEETSSTLDPTAMAVTRSSLLAAHPTLRAQHHYLVTETQTLSEDDFWKTHADLMEEEYAKIAGQSKTGPSSLMQSHLLPTGDNQITLGVEEMRQIFILYPAVYKAYEEKVPLELSEEQFWRKYLESEYFHRDRGRLGSAARDHSNNKHLSNSSLTAEQQDARAAAVGTDDLFARYHLQLKESLTTTESNHKKKWGTHLAVGQFDLASTYETERAHLGSLDMHPPNDDEDGRGARVISKYNRHWAMVLHPDDAVAGSDLTEIARKSVTQVLPNDVEARAYGGIDQEMYQLVDYANASERDADHVKGVGEDDYEHLDLSNLEGYLHRPTQDTASSEPQDEQERRRQVFCQAMANKMKRYQPSITAKDCCPDWGRNLLTHLTKRMAEDAKTDQERQDIIHRLDADFRQKLDTYFRRSSELLRHFFGLRRGGKNDAKLARIVQALEAVYREMEAVRKSLPQTEDGEIMGKMCLPIMHQLDSAFKLYRESMNTSSGGGFVDVS
jgi:transcription initiation factor TFIIH subunit 1